MSQVRKFPSKRKEKIAVAFVALCVAGYTAAIVLTTSNMSDAQVAMIMEMVTQVKETIIKK